MKVQEARELGERLSTLVGGRRIEEALDFLSPLLAVHTPFRQLDLIGARVGNEQLDAVNIFLDNIAAQRTMGGWVVIASALRQQLPSDLRGAFERCRGYVVAADVWFATDIFGERVPGPALVADFAQARAVLSHWQEDPSRWIKRMVGVAVHFWAKRSRGEVIFLPQASTLLDLLAPMFTERDTDVVKGVGWGLKTLGKHYPDLVADWLGQQVARPHRALMLRKAITYLPEELRLPPSGNTP